MRKSYSEGLANHTVPESCGISGNAGAEALTGVSAGWVLSSEMKINISGADVLQDNGRQHCIRRYGKGYAGPAESETPCMCGDTLSGNRETLHFTFRGCGKARMKNPKGERS